MSSVIDIKDGHILESALLHTYVVVSICGTVFRPLRTAQRNEAEPGNNEE